VALRRSEALSRSCLSCLACFAEVHASCLRCRGLVSCRLPHPNRFVCVWACAWQTPIKCTIRGYRKLSGDFQGNAISTGYLQSFTSPTGEINTGPISPGVTNEYDILTCRDLKVWREGAREGGGHGREGREEGNLCAACLCDACCATLVGRC
jgi:hypothetical protein